MPFSSSQFCSRGLSISQIQRFIPKKWKQPIKQIDIQTNHSYQINESMIDSLVTSLKDLASEGHLFKAFRTFSLIQLHVSSTAYFESILQPISSLLLSCTSFCLLPQGKQLHAHIIRSGLEQRPILVPKLVTFYSTVNLLDDAYSITENSNILHPLPWNLLISSYVNNGLFKKALSAYREMVDKGIRPDNFTYPSVLKACGEEFDLDFGREVHKSINASSNGWSLFVQNALVSMYGRCGEVSFARYLFDKMPEKDEVSWNTMIAACASKGMWEESIELFESMQLEGVKLNIITLNTIAGGYLRKGNFRGALEFLSLMRTRGSHLDYVAMINGLKACAHIGVVKVGKEIHSFAIRTSCDEFTNVKNALINMYSKCGDLRHAYILFRLVEAKSLITWNTMVSGFTHFDRSEEASFLFREMLLSGVEPNYVTIASLLPLCARVANLQHGKEFHCYIMRHEVFKDYLMLWNSLVDMYARSGKVLEAKRVFDLLSKKDEVTYTSLIAGYGMKGEGQAALELFEEMNRLEINPDHITMAKVLTVCSHSGLVNQGKMLFDKMLRVYGLTPRVEHYSCMVDLFGRAGLIDKAKEIIMRMPCRPTPAMWGTLLGACRIHGNTEIGEWAAEKLLEMRPENSGYYVLIANMYAAAGSWNKLAKVRTYMRDLGVRKAPGRAWVDPGTGFSHFLVGDTSNPHAGQIYPILEGLTKLMKEAGYVEGFGSDDEGFEEENTETGFGVLSEKCKNGQADFNPSRKILPSSEIDSNKEGNSNLIEEEPSQLCRGAKKNWVNVHYQSSLPSQIQAENNWVEDGENFFPFDSDVSECCVFDETLDGDVNRKIGLGDKIALGIDNSMRKTSNFCAVNSKFKRIAT